MQSVIKNGKVSIIFVVSDLNSNTKDEIIVIIQKAQRNNLKIARPIPRCVLGSSYTKTVSKYKIPISGKDCLDLVSIRNDDINSCDIMNVQGPKKHHLPDRKQIYEFINKARLEKEPNDHCKKCKYFIRRQCDGLCFRI
jgi:hypothetical protein